MVRVYFDKWNDVAFGIRISESMVIVEFWKYSLMINFKEKKG